MSRVTLIAIDARRPADGSLASQLFCHNARTKARFLGVDWQPTVIALPESELDLGFDGAKFGQSATPQIGQLQVAIGKTDSWAGLVWKGAFGSLRSAPWPAPPADPDDAAFAVDLLFRVESVSINEGVASFTLIDMGAELLRPLIARKFGSTGNALLDGAGAVDLRGRVVPTGWGKLRSVPGILVDRVNNIWLFLDRPSGSVQGFYDGGAAFTTGVARPSLAALQGTAPAAGAVDYCLDAGGLTLARPWTDPTYPFTADLTATGPQTAGDIALAVIDLRSGIDVGDGIASAFNALYPATCGLYVDDERTAATAVDELIVRLGGWWRITGAGAIALGRLAPAAPVKTFGVTEVASIARQSIVMPTRRRSVGYARNNRVHSDGEIATILLADDVAYADGTPIEALRPASAGATRNTDGFNLIPDPIELAQVWLSGGNVVRDVQPTGSRLADRYRVRSDPAGGGSHLAGWTPRDSKGIGAFPVSPGETLFYRHSVFNLLAATGFSAGFVDFFDANFGYVSTLEIPGTNVPAGLSPSTWQSVSGALQIPAGVAFAWPYAGFIGRNVASVFVAEPYFGRAQAGSTRNQGRDPWVTFPLGTTFFVGDEVLDQGSNWGCILQHDKSALNGPPTLPTATNTHWRLRSARGDPGDPGDPGPPGDDGADGAGTLPAYRRSATQPATPAPSPGIPADWFASTGDVPAGPNPMWVMLGTKPDAPSNWTWPVPTRHEAISAVNTGETVDLGFATSVILSFSLTPGESRLVRGQLALEDPAGAGEAFVQLESREENGAWTSSNGASQPYAVGEPAFPSHQITVTNSSARLLRFQVRGTGVRSNGNSGPTTPGRSIVSV